VPQSIVTLPPVVFTLVFSTGRLIVCHRPTLSNPQQALAYTVQYIYNYFLINTCLNHYRTRQFGIGRLSIRGVHRALTNYDGRLKSSSNNYLQVMQRLLFNVVYYLQRYLAIAVHKKKIKNATHCALV
jgi:hypothetical protein